MTEYVALVRFDNNDTTYRVYSDIASSAVGSLVVASAIVEREPDGRLTVAHGGSADEGSGTVTGGLIGALVGILGGPLGVLLGWGTGALIGAATDADHGDNDESLLGVISRGIEPGRNAIVLQTAEETFDDLDAFVARNGGVIVRDALANVQAEVDAEEQALKDAQKAAKAELKAKRKAEREAKHAGH